MRNRYVWFSGVKQVVLGVAVLTQCLLLQSVWATEEDYTYRLTQSTSAYTFWTTPPAERVFKNASVPLDTGVQVKVYAAKNEFEPFQVVVKPQSSGAVTVRIGDFGAGIVSEVYQVKYVNVTQASDNFGQTGPYPDPLWPIANNSAVSLTAGENTAFWFSVYVPSSTPTGDYSTTVQIGGVTIPVALHVFNFTLPETPRVKSQMNFSHQTILEHYGATLEANAAWYWTYVEKMKQYFIDHRLTPKAPLWSGGLTTNGGDHYIDYDCATATFTDNDGIWGFEMPAARYLNGTGLMNGTFSSPFNNGSGFPSWMASTFKDNDPSHDQRPSTFCGIPRSSTDWYTGNNPNSPYNQKWFTYMHAMQDYLDSLGYLDEAYYYMANEPQDQADYDAVAWYAQELKRSTVAPNLTLMVSEEPRPEIYNNPSYPGAKIDIWLPVMHNYNPAISFDRAANHDEETWIYWLRSTRPPYFNPITLDHPGIESKFTGWYLWKYRLRGIAYYSVNNWSQNPWAKPLSGGHNGELFMLYPPSTSNTPISYGANNHRFVPSIRFELMRDSLEDYEYFYLMNGNAQPQPNVANSVDAQVDKIITGVASYTRHSEFLYNLRRLIGLFAGGEISAIPDITPPIDHPRSAGQPGNYYINFQNPNGIPATTYTQETYGNGYTYSYVRYAGHDYLQVGTEAYSQTSGVGWIEDTAHFKADRDPWGSEQDERKITCVYDDYAHHPSIFEFDLPNGRYMIEVSVGTPRRVRSHNRVVIEGVPFIDDEPSQYYITRSKDVTVTDSKLTIDVGIWGEYTMLNYLNIEAASSSSSSYILWTR